MNPPFLPPFQVRSVLPVYAADPDALIAGNRYYLYPTNAGIYASMQAFEAGEVDEAGHGFAAWSSSDLRHWHNEGAILRFSQIAWAQQLDRAWAPCTAQRNGHTYFYFCAADRIGVAVGESPLGPFHDPLGAPLVPYRADLSAIDPMVFTDDDGQAYLFWGAVPAAWLHGEVEPILTHLSVQKLASDMVTLEGEEVATLTTPPEPNGHHGFGPHMEASHVIKRNGVYYLMYSQGSWSNPNDEFLYHVRYATAPHPLGPWVKQPNVVLSTRRDLGLIGPGHHSTIQIPGTDEWFIVYHWHNGDCDRRVSIDRMLFGPEGEIKPIEFTGEEPPTRQLELGLQLSHAGPFAFSTTIEIEILAHRDFKTIEIFDGHTPILVLNGDKKTFQFSAATRGFHRLWSRAETTSGEFVVSSSLDFDIF